MNLKSMDAVPAGRPETNPDHQDAKNQAIKIEFYLPDGEPS